MNCERLKSARRALRALYDAAEQTIEGDDGLAKLCANYLIIKEALDEVEENGEKID